MALLGILIAFFTTHSAPNAVPAHELAQAVITEATAQGVKPRLVAKIIMQESRGIANAYNKASKDYGLMQINHRTAASMNLTEECLKDWRCNLKAGVTVLKAAKRPCHYNTGATGALKYPELCLKYERKLASFN